MISRQSLRILLILSTLLLVTVVAFQFFWFKKAYDLGNQQFSHQVRLALHEVARDLLEGKSAQTELATVEQVTDSYYVVHTNEAMDCENLELLLKKSLLQRNIQSNFEYGIYDCSTQNMVYGNFVEMSGSGKPMGQLPSWDQPNYYFAVYFANRPANVLGGMEGWLVSSAALLVIVLFFFYALWIVLRQKRLAEVQKDFIDSMTHEFKTPLSTILISADVLMKKETGQEKLISYASIIKAEAGRLQTQVERVLQISDMEQQPFVLNREIVSMHQLIDQIKSEVLNFLADKTLVVNNQSSDDRVLADPLHLLNVLRNLVDNAIKYGGNKIQICTKTLKNQIEITVSDNGAGLSEVERTHIFKKFYRAKKGNLHIANGFGLGLYYVQLVVRAHQGSISCEQDQTCKFVINLPLYHG